MPTATETTVLPFAVEVDTRSNGDLLLQGITGLRLRSRLTPNRTRTNKRGEKVVDTNRMAAYAELGEVPGMHIHINPKDFSYRITDPLKDKKDILDKIRRALVNKRQIDRKTELRPVETIVGDFVRDKHRFKTLVRELLWLLESGDVRLIKGVKPTMEGIENLPGKFLQNPGSLIPNSQPRYEEDMEEWVSNLNRVGG